MRSWRLGSLAVAEPALGEGSIRDIPRGSVLVFPIESDEPAIAHAVVVSAFDGRDRAAAP